MKITVSICCVTFNHAKYIHKCIEGILMQKTNFLFELIIHDDASTDSTQLIIQEYKKKYPDLIIAVLQKKNKYSKGIKINPEILYPICKGKYIALCDGDDYWTDPKKLQKQVDFLENNEDYFMCFTNSMIVDKNDDIIQSQFFSNSKHSFNANDLFQKKNPISTLTTMFKSEYLSNEILKNIKSSVWGDWTTWSSLAVQSKKKIGYLNEVCAAYRITKDGAYSGISSQIIRERNIAHHKTNLILFGDEYEMEIKKTLSQLTFEYFDIVQKESKYKGILYLFLNLKWILYRYSIRDILYVLRMK